MQGGGEELSIEELASNLSTYKEQLQQVKRRADVEQISYLRSFKSRAVWNPVIERFEKRLAGWKRQWFTFCYIVEG